MPRASELQESPPEGRRYRHGCCRTRPSSRAQLKSAFSLKLFDLEKSGVGVDPLNEFIGRGRARKAQIDGDLENGDIYSGSSAGLIREIVSAAEIVKSLIESHHKAIRKNNAWSL